MHHIEVGKMQPGPSPHQVFDDGNLVYARCVPVTDPEKLKVEDDPTNRRDSVLRIGVVLMVTAAIGMAVTLHLAGINGPWYWKWEWRRLSTLRVFAVTLICILPLLGAQIAYHRRRINGLTGITLASISVILLQIGFSGVNTPAFDLTRVWKIVADPAATSYFSDAAKLIDHNHILSAYPELLEGQLTFHSITKPPGPVVFYVSAIRWFGLNPAAALVGALVIGLLAAMGVPAAYFLYRALGASDRAAFFGASAFALCTGPIVFFPEFDQTYVLTTCLFLGFWWLAIKHDRWHFSFLNGGILALGLFFAYHIVVLGLFVAVSALIWLDEERSLARLARVAKHGAVSSLAFLGSYVLLWLFFGFNGVATFMAAVSNQEMMKAKFAEAGMRIYPATVIPDLVDFALGAGWLPLIMAPLFMVVLYRRWGGVRVVAFGCTCLLQIAVVIVSGQIAAETARTLVFLLPLLFFPIGLGLERWSLPERLVFLGAMAVLTALNFQNMVFLSV